MRKYFENQSIVSRCCPRVKLYSVEYVLEFLLRFLEVSKLLTFSARSTFAKF